MKYISLVLGLLLASTTWAAIPPGQWQCMAFDSKENSYEAFGMNMKEAMKAAELRCKKETKKGACKTAQSFCEQGPISLNAERCLVADENGRSWTATGPCACKNAIDMCNKWQYLHGVQSQCSVKHAS